KMEKLFFCRCLQDCLIHILPNNTVVGWPAFLLRPPLAIRCGLSRLRMFDYRQTILLTKAVRDGTHIPIVLIGSVIPFSICVGNRVDHKMIMKMMGFVQMGCYQYLKTISPQFLCQSDTDLMGQCRSTLSRCKG